jgi:hypothetical protein
MSRLTPNDAHREAQDLLPWYLTGRLDADETAMVEAHLAECETCRADLRVEGRLNAKIARMPLDVEQGWADMRRRIEGGGPPRRPERQGGATWVFWPKRGQTGVLTWATWGLAAQAFLVLVSAVIVLMTLQPDRYRTLGSGARRDADVLVMFRPETNEAALRRALTAADARIVDGPTAGGAYLVSARSKDDRGLLGALRASPDVVLAEPLSVDGGR